MIIAGPCLLTEQSEIPKYIELSQNLSKIADKYRVKLWGGGTKTDRYYPGIGKEGLPMIEKIGKNMPVGVEVQSESQLNECRDIVDYIWIGARNCQNYALLKSASFFHGDVFIKRGPSLTVEETIDLYDIMVSVHGKRPYIIERGINAFDRSECRWAPDIVGSIKIKVKRPDVFERYVADCSHSAGSKEYVKYVYRMFKTAGVNHYMFECTMDGKSKTDQAHMLAYAELEEIING